MTSYMGFKNMLTREKLIVNIDKGESFNTVMRELPCGVYCGFYLSMPQSDYSKQKQQPWLWDIKCKKCDGTGKGGKCMTCYGSCMDPELLERFDKEKGQWNTTTLTTPHPISSCNSCNKAWVICQKRAV